MADADTGAKKPPTGAPEGQPPTRPSNNIAGILWMLASTLSIAGMHTTIQHVSETVHPFIVVFFRLFFALVVVIPFFVKHGAQPLKTDRLGMLVLRGVINIMAMICFFTALSVSPIADVTALSFTAPLFATLFAIFFLKERVGWRRATAIGVGFGGTMLVLRPGFSEISLGYGLVILASVFWGACIVIIRDLGRTESSVTITTYMSLVMAPLALVPALFVWTTPSLVDFGWLLLLGLFGGAGQLAFSQALRHAETHVAIPFDYVRLIWVSITGYVFFGHVPDGFIWIGGSLIFASTAYITYREHRRHQQQRHPRNESSSR